MNISSVLIRVKQEFKKEAIEYINKVKNCNVELNEDDKIIVLIECESLEDELSSYKQLELTPNLISINMVFSYQDLDEDIQNANESKFLESVQKTQDAKDINYYGSIYKKI